MQLPTSISAAPLTPSISNRSAEAPSKTAEASSNTIPAVSPSPKAQQPTRGVETQSAPDPSRYFSPVDQGNDVDPAREDLSQFRSQESRSSNPAVNSYQQVANSSVNRDAEVFRIDVYV